MISSEAKLLSDEMILEAAHAVSKFINNNEKGASVLPKFKDVSSVSKSIAKAIYNTALKQGLSLKYTDDIESEIEKNVWIPRY